MTATATGRAISKRLSLCLAAIFAFCIFATVPCSAAQAKDAAVVLRIDGAIGPATAAYVGDGLEQARDEGARLVILAVDTPGGLDSSMRDIIQDILAMPIPVVTYVHPSGARAASAGTYILYASHVAAMTPGTNLGAATPIQIGAAPQPGQDEATEKGKGPQKTAQERKAVNDAVAYIRSLAELRGRNADWAEKAVREAASLSAEAALQQGIVEVVAADMTSLLKQLDGHVVTIDGKSRTLKTAGLAIEEIEPDWMFKVLATITDPNVALILMMIGIYGLIFEFMNPGSLVPGTIGAVSLLLGLYALAVLPVDVVGLALILLGIALMVGEAFAPSFGILGIGGLAAFVFGAAILFDTEVPAFQIDWGIIAALAVFSAVLLIFVARIGIRAQRGSVQTGQQQIVGAHGTVLDWAEGRGHVFVRSERWSASGPPTISAGDTIVVDAIDGLKLRISPLAPAEP